LADVPLFDPSKPPSPTGPDFDDLPKSGQDRGE
jgi:hypothetical protein